MGDVCSIPLSFMNQIDAQNIQNIDKLHLIKALSMITGAIKGLNELDQQLLEQTLLPIIQAVWDKLMAMLTIKAADTDLVATTCKLIQEAIRVLASSIINVDFFNNLSQALITSFRSNFKNLSSIQTFAFLCKETGRRSDELK